MYFRENCQSIKFYEDVKLEKSYEIYQLHSDFNIHNESKTTLKILIAKFKCMFTLSIRKAFPMLQKKTITCA